MDLMPNIQISNCNGGYVVCACVRCSCEDEECDGWIEEHAVFTDITAMMRYVQKCVEDYDSRDELRDAVESKLRK